jgi:hypothetical protein
MLCAHNLWSQPQPYRVRSSLILVGFQLMEVFVSNVKKSWQLCVHFPANAPRRASGRIATPKVA